MPMWNLFVAPGFGAHAAILDEAESCMAVCFGLGIPKQAPDKTHKLMQARKRSSGKQNLGDPDSGTCCAGIHKGSNAH